MEENSMHHFQSQFLELSLVFPKICVTGSCGREWSQESNPGTLIQDLWKETFSSFRSLGMGDVIYHTIQALTNKQDIVEVTVPRSCSEKRTEW